MEIEKTSMVVVDHQPSVVENVFPRKIVEGLYKSHDVLVQEDFKKILGEKRFEKFLYVLSRNTLPFDIEEFFSPVIPLYYYNNLAEVESKQNREALKSHGSSHGVIEGIHHPEGRLLWRRIVEIAEDIILYDDPKKDALSIMNNSLLITSLLPIEEARATYLEDWPRADQERRDKLIKFETKDIKELYQANKWNAIFEWPYITAGKSVAILKKVGYTEIEIGGFIRKCNLAASGFELIASRQDWSDIDDRLISNLPYFVSLLRNSEDIKNGNTTIGEVFNQTESIDCFQLSSTIYQPQLELEDSTELKKQSLNVWKAWKTKNIIDGIIEGDLALATLHYLADYIATSLIIVESSIGLEYDILIPKMVKYEREILEIIPKIKYLLLRLNPTFDTYDIDLTKGERINIQDIEFTFPKIIPSKDSIRRIKEIFDKEDNFCKEVEEDLENLGQKIELEKKIQAIINSSPNL